MFDIHQNVFEDEDYDETKIREYINGLMKEFAASPEAKPLLDSGKEIGWASVMMDYGFDYLGDSPAEMTLDGFREVLFELFPRKVSTPPESASEIVEELRAFWQFVARQYGLDNAAPILSELNESASGRLRKELADPANFGMAKSFVTLGQEAGFDMTSQQGCNEFLLAYNTRLLAGRSSLPLLPFEKAAVPADGFRHSSPNYRTERRKARKRQRQARKRNRK